MEFLIKSWVAKKWRLIDQEELLMKKISVNKIVNKFLKEKAYHEATSLCALMMVFGSDKGGPRHNYTTLYSRLFEAWKNEEVTLFELGIGTTNENIPSNMGKEGVPGASLMAWDKFFPNGKIYGADIDRTVLFQAERIKTFYCDQNDPKIINQLFNSPELKDVSFDIIIDDAVHLFEYNLTFLTNSIHKLKRGGIYIVEDLNTDTTFKFSMILKELKENFQLSYIEIVEIPFFNEFLLKDNTLLVIQK